MFPPVFEVCDTEAVNALIGRRLFPAGRAPQGVAKPYAVWQIIAGGPENYLSSLPDVDNYTVQIDAYADSVSDARDVARALRDAIEPRAYVVSVRESTEGPTSLARYSFDVDWIIHR